MIKLKIYETSLDLAIEIFQLLKCSDLQYEYGLAGQLKRAAISVPANISEGYLRSKKVFYNHLSIALGSANEVVTLLIFIERVSKIPTNSLADKYIILCKQIITFRKRLTPN